VKVFVTGATGFIGQHLVQALLKDGHQVVALIRPGREIPPGCQEVRGDLLDVNSFVHCLEGVDGVVHLAALLDPVESEELAWKVNYEATLELARAATAAGARHFVFASSIAAIGFPGCSGLIKPDAPCDPTTAYGESKRSCEIALLDPESGYLPVSVLRPPTVYGVGERRNFLSLTRAVATGAFPVPGRGENRMSFCHVSNVVDALCFLLKNAHVNGLFHVADPDRITLKLAATTIADSLGARLLPVPFPLFVAKVAAISCELIARPLGKSPILSLQRLDTLTRDFALDCSSLAEAGFVAETTFAQGVEATIRWYRSVSLVE